MVVHNTMKKLYKQLVNDISNYLNRAPTYVANCILGRYKAKRSEIPVFIMICHKYGIQVSERDFLCGTRISNNSLLRMFRLMHSKSKHEKLVRCPQESILTKNKIIYVEF